MGSAGVMKGRIFCVYCEYTGCWCLCSGCRTEHCSGLSRWCNCPCCRSDRDEIPSIKHGKRNQVVFIEEATSNWTREGPNRPLILTKQEKLRLKQLQHDRSAAASAEAEILEDQAPVPRDDAPLSDINPQGCCNCYHYHYSAAVGCQTPLGPPGSSQLANNPGYCVDCFEHGCICHCPGCRT